MPSIDRNTTHPGMPLIALFRLVSQQKVLILRFTSMGDVDDVVRVQFAEQSAAAEGWAGFVEALARARYEYEARPTRLHILAGSGRDVRAIAVEQDDMLRVQAALAHLLVEVRELSEHRRAAVGRRREVVPQPMKRKMTPVLVHWAPTLCTQSGCIGRALAPQSPIMTQPSNLPASALKANPQSRHQPSICWHCGQLHPM